MHICNPSAGITLGGSLGLTGGQLSPTVKLQVSGTPYLKKQGREHPEE